MVAPITRICKKCGLEKQLFELVSKKKSKYGREKLCKSCKYKLVSKNKTSNNTSNQV